MSATKHTPGPWGIERRQSTGYGASSAPYEIWARGSQSFTVALLNGRESPEIEANANLIAAAPELDNAAGLAITALSFAQETYQHAGDIIALAQTTAAKEALIAAQDKARGRARQMLNVTPAKVEGRAS